MPDFSAPDLKVGINQDASKIEEPDTTEEKRALYISAFMMVLSIPALIGA